MDEREKVLYKKNGKNRNAKNIKKWKSKQGKGE